MVATLLAYFVLEGVDVTFGRCQGVQGAVGFDDLWKNDVDAGVSRLARHALAQALSEKLKIPSVPLPRRTLNLRIVSDP